MAKLYSLRSELALVSGLCDPNPKRSGWLLARVDETYFYTEEGREAYAAISSYLGSKGRTPKLALLTESPQLTRSTRDALRDAPRAPDKVSDCEALLDQLHEYRQTRAYYVMARTVLNELEKAKVNPNDLSRLVSEAQASASLRRSLDDCMFTIGTGSNVDALVQEMLFNPQLDNWIPTGWETFDKVNGGMPRGGLITIGGNSGSGKSHTVLSLGSAQAEMGYNIVILPLEMTEQEQLARYIARVSSTDSLKINLGKLAREEAEAAYRRFRRADRRIAKAGGRLTIFRPKEDIAIEEALAACHSQNPDGIYIDYIGLLKGADGDDQWRKLGQIARYGKVHAGNTDSFVALAAQVSDDGKVRYSQTIKEHSSLAFTFVATKDSKAKGLLNVSMLKGRNQKMFDFVLRIIYEHSMVRDLQPDELKDVAAPAVPPGAGGKDESGSMASFVPELD